MYSLSNQLGWPGRRPRRAERQKSKIRDLPPAADGLDGNGDGVGGDNYVLAADPTPNPPGPLTGIFRFFGDATGNGAADAADFLQFRTDYVLTNVPNSPFDFDGNGSVDAADFLQFRNRYLLTYLP